MEGLEHETGKKRKVDEAVLPGVTKKAKLDGSQPEHATHEWMEEEISSHHWKRPAPQINPATDNIIFLQLDTDYSLGPIVPGVSSVSSGPAPFVRLFGVTEQGNSVYASIHGFMPYFWVPAPAGFTQAHCALFRRELDKEVLIATGKKEFEEHVLNVTIENKQSIMGYSTTRIPFLRITMCSPRLVPVARNILHQGQINLPGFQSEFQTYESDIPFILRWMIDSSVLGANWVEAKAGDYQLVTNEAEKESTCQIEIRVNYEKLISHSTEGEWAKIAPLRILSFDIECAARPGTFPDPEEDRVIQIANIVSVFGQENPIARNIFCLNGCAPIIGAEVLSFSSEKELLEQWTNFVREADPDIITGYNISNFDFSYLMNRARKLQAHKFPFLGRLRQEKSKLKDTSFSSKAYGRRDSKVTTTTGRVQLDMIQIIQREYKLRSYSLNAVSAHFLGQQKEDVHHSIITTLFEGSDEDRRRLAVYCLKDAYLPLKLMKELMVVVNFLEMARVTGIPVSYILSRGQQIKVISQLYRKSLQEGLLIPTLKGKAEDTEGYTGATVISPKAGYYDLPIATLDFSSLYPSIMMAHNLCYSTIVDQSQVKRLNPDDYERTPSGDVFVKGNVKRGILPCILEELLAARSNARKQLAEATDPAIKSVLNGRQLALKISANSVYGFTGATVGKLPCLAISSSVTSYGREMIEKTKRLVEERYTIANGYSHDAEVIYGDTDSVMIRFGTSSIEEAMKLGLEGAEFVSTTFKRPISLAFEKVYCPYLLMSKKRYAGLLWTKPSKYDKLEAKGIVSVRRDNCTLVKDVIETCLEKILIDRDVKGAEEYAKKVISDLLCNRLDLSLLVITKALAKTEYAVKQAHTELAERMRKRDPGSAPNLGDRVPYVIAAGVKGAKGYEKAEDPLYALEHSIPLDTQYYLHHQLANPLLDIFTPILKNPQSLLNGEHTRSIAIATPTHIGIGAFGVLQKRCLGCNCTLRKDRDSLCESCEAQEDLIYQQQLAKVTVLEQQFSRVWTQCQNCQGSLHQPVLCTSRDCPIFYMRKKIQKDLKESQQALERFTFNDW